MTTSDVDRATPIIIGSTCEAEKGCMVALWRRGAASRRREDAVRSGKDTGGSGEMARGGAGRRGGRSGGSRRAGDRTWLRVRAKDDGEHARTR